MISFWGGANNCVRLFNIFVKYNIQDEVMEGDDGHEGHFMVFSNYPESYL